MKISVIQASSSRELECIYRFRYRVYVEELGMVSEADCDNQLLRDELDNYSISYAVVIDGEILGSLRMTCLSNVPNPSLLIQKFGMQPVLEKFGAAAICTTSRFILDPKLRHGKVIFRLMQAAFIEGQQRNIRFNYGDCSPQLIPFYEHLGFRRYTLGYNDTVYGFKLPILMLTGDRDFFDEVRSPLRRIVRQKPDDVEARNWFRTTYSQYQSLGSASFLADNVFFDLLTKMVSKDPLHHLSILRGLTQDEAESFLSEATLLELKPGSLVVRQGDRDNTIFVLLTGFVDIIIGEKYSSPLTTLKPGDTFGEIEFLTTVPRTSSILAQTDCSVLVISGIFMDRFIIQQSSIASKVLFNLARELAIRLSSTNVIPSCSMLIADVV